MLVFGRQRLGSDGVVLRAMDFVFDRQKASFRRRSIRAMARCEAVKGVKPRWGALTLHWRKSMTDEGSAPSSTCQFDLIVNNVS